VRPVAIIDNGEIVEDGSPTDLKREIVGDVVMVGLDGGDPRAPEAAVLLRDEPRVRRVELTGEGVRPYVDVGATVRCRVFLARTGRSPRDNQTR
jgi:ABC-2 type transport system ATP-binding protein